jgi:sec-independent protein translocase protein TatA
MFGLGTGEIILILLIILIFFGAKKIPELAQGLGKGMREFRKAARDIQDEIDRPEDQKKADRLDKTDKPDKSDKPA